MRSSMSKNPNTSKKTTTRSCFKKRLKKLSKRNPNLRLSPKKTRTWTTTLRTYEPCTINCNKKKKHGKTKFRSKTRRLMKCLKQLRQLGPRFRRTNFKFNKKMMIWNLPGSWLSPEMKRSNDALLTTGFSHRNVKTVKQASTRQSKLCKRNLTNAKLSWWWWWGSFRGKRGKRRSNWRKWRVCLSDYNNKNNELRH